MASNYFWSLLDILDMIKSDATIYKCYSLLLSIDYN